WLMKGNQRTAGGYIARGVDTAWKIVGAADLTHSRSSGLIWQNSRSGDVVFWPMTGAVWSGTYRVISSGNTAGWKVVGTADLDGDGNVDILFQNASNGDVIVWYMIGASFRSYAYITYGNSVAWAVEAVMDTNNDTNADLIWRNSSTGDVIV